MNTLSIAYEMVNPTNWTVYILTGVVSQLSEICAREERLAGAG
jgi:hypothetical protein